MDFNYYDLGELEGGEVAEITLLGNAANVKLLDAENYALYKAAKEHKFLGGLAKRNTTKLQVPSAGHWFVTVDMHGLIGSTKSIVKVTEDPGTPIEPFESIQPIPYKPPAPTVAAPIENIIAEAEQQPPIIEQAQRPIVEQIQPIVHQSPAEHQSSEYEQVSESQPKSEHEQVAEHQSNFEHMQVSEQVQSKQLHDGTIMVQPAELGQAQSLKPEQESTQQKEISSPDLIISNDENKNNDS